MRPIFLAALFASSLASAHAEDSFVCQGKGECVCTETINPASVLGYNPTEDKQSVYVSIVCINQDTKAVSYYRRRREDGLGATYSAEAVPHE